MIVIVDYGMGNLRSIQNKIERLDKSVIISSSLDDIERADRLILPGVGAFDAAMANLKRLGMIPVLDRKVLRDHVPILGICLGMQLFSKFSEEGNAEGLGWIDARTVRFDFGGNGNGLKIPHMGWNSITVRKPSPVLDGIDLNANFYFVHSYHVRCNDAADVLATTEYGLEFASMVQRDNITGAQFHPEKSHFHGVHLLENFARGS
ncbi:MAG TPA: imidazole glycerol phosphate synthase subunit HisH [Methanocella sp.]|jgi:glutamine amidotransferase